MEQNIARFLKKWIPELACIDNAFIHQPWKLTEIDLIDKNIVQTNDLIDLKDHKIKASYTNKKLSIKGIGKVKLLDKFDLIDYEVEKKGSNFDLVSNIELSEINIKNQNLIKEYLPNTKDTLNLKDHKIKASYVNNKVSIKGKGKIKLCLLYTSPSPRDRG